MKRKTSICVHGGAGNVPLDADPDQVAACRSGLARAVEAGSRVLDAGGAALDAVEQAVRILEDDQNFNAGRGAVYTAAGTHELDAAICCGASGGCGAVTGLRRRQNPISVARRLLARGPAVLLAGEGAESFAAAEGFAAVDPEYFTTPRRLAQLRAALAAGEQRLDHDGATGTVGAVASDQHGHVAAATSTGGLTGKLPGRVGDSPLPGAGTWADDRSCAISCTGVGEIFIRQLVAHAVHCRMRLQNLPLTQAVDAVFANGLPNDCGGLIAIDAASGSIYLRFNTQSMYRAWRTSDGTEGTAVW